VSRRDNERAVRFSARATLHRLAPALFTHAKHRGHAREIHRR
jgi:hypothetical protein